MVKKQHIKTSFDLFVKILKLEKDECAFDLFQANEKLEVVNQKIKEVKQKIIFCERSLREGVGAQGETLRIENYELIRNNLLGMEDALKPLLVEEEKNKEIYQAALEALQHKTRKHEKVIDKQLVKRDEILLEKLKKMDIELDDLSAQREWVSEHG